MEVLVCKTCDEVIDYLESDKAGTIYGCCQCDCEKEENGLGMDVPVNK